MKPLKLVVLSAFCTLCAFTTIFYTSCTKSSDSKCKNVTCINGGACDASTGLCICPTGFSGVHCEIADPCAGIACQNGGTCSGGICACPTGYTGTLCQTADACAGIVCQNGGTCSGGTCSCPAGYEGTLCQTEVRSKFIRSWNATEITSTGINQVYTTSITAGTTIVQVTIANTFANNFFVHSINATVSGNTITITSQTPDSDGYAVAGTATYNASSSQLTWAYTISNTNVTPNQVVSVTGVWQ